MSPKTFIVLILLSLYSFSQTADANPDPSKTKFVQKPPTKVAKGSEVIVLFKLSDSDGKVLDSKSDFIKNMTVLNDGKKFKANITLDEDKETFRIAFTVSSDDTSFKINVELAIGEKPLKLFESDLEIKVGKLPNFEKSTIVCDSFDFGETYEAGSEYLLVDAYLYYDSEEEECADDDDFSSLMNVVIVNPNDKKEHIYPFTREKVEPEPCGYKYTVTVPKEQAFIYAGTETIYVVCNGKAVKTYTKVVTAAKISKGGFKITFPSAPGEVLNVKVKVNETFLMYVNASDKYGNPVRDYLSDIITMEIQYNDTSQRAGGCEVSDDFSHRGVAIYTIKCTTKRNRKIALTFYDEDDDEEVDIYAVNGGKPLPVLIFEDGGGGGGGDSGDDDDDNPPIPSKKGCVSRTSLFDLKKLGELILGIPSYFTLICVDSDGKNLTKGGAEFDAEGYCEDTNQRTTFDVNITDLGNGKYIFGFTPKEYGVYYVSITLKGEPFGKPIRFFVEENHCKDETKFLCPNENKCVKEAKECLPKSDCDAGKPFKCPGENGACVASQSDCECPKFFTKCKTMGYCIPEGREDMCPSPAEEKCEKYKPYGTFCFDGICRKSTDLAPSRYVCPIGFKLCPDLTCREKVEDCYLAPKCKEKQVRCFDQTCADSYADCPTMITCPTKGQVICPDEKCVAHEYECKPLIVCPEDKPYRCRNNFCVKDPKICPPNIPCGHRMILCEDLVCRVEYPIDDFD